MSSFTLSDTNFNFRKSSVYKPTQLHLKDFAKKKRGKFSGENKRKIETILSLEDLILPVQGKSTYIPHNTLKR